MSLDSSNTDHGYLLGRLFSTLENIQRAALGQLNAPIGDRYYGAASATPASVFPMLLRNARHHLSRLRKDKPGLAVNLQKEVGEIIDPLGSTFPKSLRIEARATLPSAITTRRRPASHAAKVRARSTSVPAEKMYECHPSPL